MTYHTMAIGDPVWAPIGLEGPHGWRAGTVEGLGHMKYELTRIKIRFAPSKSKPHGQLGHRLIKELVSRNPELNGKDKPARTIAPKE